MSFMSLLWALIPMIQYRWPYPGSVLRQHQYLNFQHVPFASSAWMPRLLA